MALNISKRRQNRLQKRIEARRSAKELKAQALDASAKHRALEERVGRILKERALRAKYDVAQTTPNNRNWWSMADSLSAKAANSAAVRQTTRNRARYEVANGPWLAGIVKTLAEDVVGTGPRLQMNAEMSDKDTAIVEKRWWEYAQRIDLADTLKVMRKARCVDGETFAMFVNNRTLLRNLYRGPTRKTRTPTVDLRPIECDQFSASLLGAEQEPDMVDGVRYERGTETPVSYEMLTEHPGDALGLASYQTITVPAYRVVHDFQADRPGQLRGISEMVSSLSLFSQMRDYRQAVLDTAKAAAYFTLVLQNSSNPQDTEEELTSMDELELERNIATVLPQGYTLGQVNPTQPTTQFSEFMHENLNEGARPLGMPYNIASGNSAGYNYSSGKLDHKSYHKMITNDRNHMGLRIVDRLFDEWAREAVLIEGYLPQSFRTVMADWSHTWMWDGFEDIDEEKASKAQTNRLNNRTTTFKEEFAIQGKDWRREMEQQAVEQNYMESLGLRRQNVVDRLDMDPGEEKVEETETVTEEEEV